MKQVCLSSNVVFVFNRNVYEEFNTDVIEEKVKNAYSTQEPEIGSTNFPNEIKAVFSPSQQVQVVGQQKNLIISDSKINETNEVADTNFLRLALNVKNLFTEASLLVKDFGFNYTFTLQDE